LQAAGRMHFGLDREPDELWQLLVRHIRLAANPLRLGHGAGAVSLHGVTSSIRGVDVILLELA